MRKHKNVGRKYEGISRRMILIYTWRDDIMSKRGGIVVTVQTNRMHTLSYYYNNVLMYLKKCTAHPLQVMQALRGLGELRLLDFLTSALYGDRLSASRTGRL
jgi:hypothetical protein